MAKNHDSAQHSGLSLDVQPQFSSDAEPLVGTSSKFKEYLELQKPPAPYSQRRSPVDFWKLTSLQDFYTFSHSQYWQYPVIDSNQHENSLDKGTTRCDSQAQSAISKKRQNESRETLNRNEQHLAKNQDYTIFQKSCDKVNSSSTHRALNESVPFKKGPLKLRKSWFNQRNKSLAYHCKHFAKESEQQTNEQELFVLDFPDEHALEMEVLEGIYKNTNRQRRFQMPTNFGTLVENQTEEFYLNANTNSEASCSPSQSCLQCQKSCSPMEKLTTGTITITSNYEKAGPPVPPKSNGLTLGSKTPLTQNPAIKTRKHADVQLSKVSLTKPYYKKSNLTISKQLSLAHESDDSIDSPPPFTGTYFPPRQQQFDVYGFVRHNYYSHLKPTAQSSAKKQSSGSNLARKGATNQPKGEKPAVSFQNRVSMHTINGTKAQHNLQNHEIHPHHDPHHHEHPHHHHQHHNPNRLSHVRHSSSTSSPHSHERGKSYIYLNDLDQHQYPTAVDEHLDVATCRPAARTLNTPAALAPAINDEDDDVSSTKSADRPKRSTSQSSSYSSSSSSSDLGNMKKKLKVFPANHHKKRKHKDHGKHSADILPHHNSTQEFNVTKGDGTDVSEPASENSKKGSTSSKLEEQASDDDGDTEGSSTSNGSNKSSKKHKDSTDSSGTSNSTSKSKGRSCDEASQKKALPTNPCCYYINTCPSYTYGYQPSGYYGYGGYPGAAQSAYALPNSAYGTYGSPYDPNVYSGAQWPSGPFSCCYPPHTEGPHQASHMEKLSSSRCASPNKETPPPACQAPGYNQQPFSPQLWMNQCLEPFKDMNTNCFQLSPNVFSGQANPPTQTQDLNGNYSQNGYFGNPYCCPMIFYCCPPQPEPPKDNKKPCRRKKVAKKNVFQLPPALTSFPDKPRGCTMESPPKCNNCCPDDYCCASDGDCCNNFCCVENCKCPFGML